MSDTTALPNKCIECGKRTNKVNRSLDNPDLCNKCFQDAELENEHNDSHQDGKGIDCRFCDTENELIYEHWTKVHPLKVDGCEECTTIAVIDRGEVDPIWYEQADKPAKQTPTAQHRFDHSGCDHPKTPKDRDQCRKTGAAAKFYGRLKAATA